MKLGIIGQGFVGNAVYQKFKNYYKVLTYDIQAMLCNATMEEVCQCDHIFICLPTPMDKDGKCHIDIVEEALAFVDKHSKAKTAIIKSTVVPGTTNNWNDKFNIDVVFNPEFLTEANAVSDYENQTRIILGGPRKATTKLKPIFAKVFPKASIIKTDSTYAEMVKYVTNAFLATKVSFANEMYRICDKLGIDYDKVVEYSTYDERLGKSHWAVPGPDGHYGFGGSCFPKDINALIKIAEKMDVPPNILSAAWDTNTLVRPEEDWKELKGRAVVEEKA